MSQLIYSVEPTLTYTKCFVAFSDESDFSRRIVMLLMSQDVQDAKKNEQAFENLVLTV